MIYHHLAIDYMKYNLMGVEKKELEEVMMNNLTPILERFFADLEKFTALKNSGKTKIVSNLQKLQKKLTVMQIIKKNFKNAFMIALSRLVEFQFDNFLIEFDRSDQNEVIKKSPGKKITYNQYFNGPERKTWLHIDISNMNLILLNGAVNCIKDRVTRSAIWQKVPKLRSVILMNMEEKDT